MLAAWVLAAIALAAIAFMLSFLIALLRESAPSVSYWVVPVRREPEKEEHLRILRGIDFDDAGRATTSDDYRLQLMENDHAEEKCTSGLIARAVRPTPYNVVWRSVDPRRGNVVRGRRL
jgi:hypothetical protein